MADIQKQTVIIADNDPDFLDWSSKHLEAESVEILTTVSSEEAFKLFEEKEADLLIAEFNLRPIEGLELLKKVRLSHPNAMVILNGQINSTNAVIESMRLGAFDVLRRESINFELRQVAEEALQSAEQMKAAADTADSSRLNIPS